LGRKRKILKEEKCFKDAVFLEGELEKIVERVYELYSLIEDEIKVIES